MGKSKGKRSKAKRRARGTGTIFWSEPDRCWIGRKPIGRGATGGTRYVERWGATQAEVIRKLDAAGPPSPDVTVAGWAARWKQTWSMRPGTRDDYEDSLRLHILPALGPVRLRDVTPSRVEAFAVSLGKAGGLGANTVRKVLRHLGTMFKAAERDDLVPKNPVSLARKPKGKKKDIDPFTPAEMTRLILEAMTRPTTYPFAVAAGTGCRIGEAFALDAGDFDPTTGKLTITKTYDVEHDTGPPKSAAGERIIRVPGILCPVFAAAAGGRKKGEPLFVSGPGKRRFHQSCYAFWVSLLERLGMRYRNIHQLRHSVATALISAGEPIGDVAKYIGDTPDTVVKTYLHPTGTDPADCLDRLYGGGKVGDQGVKSPDATKSRRPRAV